MMKRIALTTSYCLPTVALLALIGMAPPHLQSQNTVPRDQDSDLTHRQLAAFDQFLDSHPEVARELRDNPSLVNNEEFVENHPDLQQYLQQHPEVREELNQNPNAAIDQEERYDRREDQLRDRDGDRDTTRGELATMDRFMDSHPEIAVQLRKNPSLIDNQEFIEDHPALKQFLAEHPGVRQEYRENPNAFMQQEERYDRREDSGFRGDSDVNRRELSNMNRFMENHPEIAEQLRKNPSLVDNKEFVENHPALKTFLAQHQSVAEELRENPNGFMAQEQRFDRRQDAELGRNGDVARGGISSFHDFLEHHNNIAAELTKNPSLATNEEYLENHSELKTYLKANPQVREELGENPQAFVKSAQGFETTPKSTAKLPIAEPKLK
jgi:hypothetical protein